MIRRSASPAGVPTSCSCTVSPRRAFARSSRASRGLWNGRPGWPPSWALHRRRDAEVPGDGPDRDRAALRSRFEAERSPKGLSAREQIRETLPGAATCMHTVAVVLDGQGHLEACSHADLHRGCMRVPAHVAEQLAKCCQQMLREVATHDGVDGSVELNGRVEAER